MKVKVTKRLLSGGFGDDYEANADCDCANRNSSIVSGNWNLRLLLGYSEEHWEHVHGWNLKFEDYRLGRANWRDGVTATWTATNMKPGDEFPFEVEFVGLGRAGTITPSSLEITCNYSVIEESPQTESDTDPNTNLHPDAMANQMIITRFMY